MTTQVASITPEAFGELYRTETVLLIDVRTPAEFEELHVRGARNVPLDQLDPARLFGADADRSRRVYVICRSGSRGRQGCEKLLAAGWTDVINIEGGTLACEAAALPMNRGRKMISLERQVRIVAGGIALIGAALAVLLDPWFAVIPAFVGAGLMHAGITDSCAMGMILARMPWNHRKPIAREACGAK